MILAGDIGGTHTRLALFDGNSHEPLALTIYPGREHSGLEEDPVYAQALDLMVSIYGAEAGNLALRLLPTGGIYIGGRIALHILPKLRQHSFLESLTAKGRFRAMLEQIPVHVILNERASLLGAARIAWRESPHIHRTEPPG
jgi:glucokinase